MLVQGMAGKLQRLRDILYETVTFSDRIEGYRVKLIYKP